MTTHYPRAQLRMLGKQTEPRMTRYDIVCLHTMVGTLAGTESMFLQGGFSGTESHLGIGGYGEVRQWQDLDYQADANGDGNHRILSVETADKGAPFPAWSGSNVPPWTDPQVEEIAQFCAWAHKKYGIPLELVPDSKSHRRGIAYHRQGCDGNYPDRRVPGGEKWSPSFGKVCPGDARIAQIPGIIARAKEIASGRKLFRTRIGTTLAAIAVALGLSIGSLTTLNPGISPDDVIAPSATITAPAEAPATSNELVETIEPPAPAPAPPAPATPATSATAAYQARLNELGYGLVLDGIKGPKTKAAIVDVQRRCGITRDGIYGPDTASCVGQLIAAKVSTSNVVRLGDRGPKVATLQKKLRAAGYSVAIDSIAGNKTIGAVYAVQVRCGITRDRIAGPATNRCLDTLTSTSTTRLARVLRVGSKGADVKALQTAIGAKPDSIFGSETATKLRAYQRSRGLTVDAKAGRQVAGALGWTWAG